LVVYILEIPLGIYLKDYVRDFGATIPVWGTTSAPLVSTRRLICLVGGENGATAVAFDKYTGRLLWKAIPSGSEPGYAQPVLVENAGSRQVILWHPRAVYALDPVSGRILWQQPFEVSMGLTVATPVISGSRLLVSSFYNGSLMLELTGICDVVIHLAAAVGVKLIIDDAFAFRTIAHSLPPIKSFRKNETELVVIVTPHLVKPLDMAKQTLPTDQFIEPDDFEFYLLGHLEGQEKGEQLFGYADLDLPHFSFAMFMSPCGQARR
jgi:hypothetical protein